MSRFVEATVTPQKRIAQARHWELARSLLRARDGVHHAAWDVLMLAGGSPRGEIDIIRQLMPRASITAVDRDPACVEAARMAGADEAVVADLGNWDLPVGDNGPYKRVPSRLYGPWAVISLDLCGTPTIEMREIVARYKMRASVTLLTFSYGRDVREVGQYARYTNPDLVKAGCPPAIADRVSFLTGEGALAEHRSLAGRYPLSVVAYMGARMPMCSVLLGRGMFARRMPIKFLRVNAEGLAEGARKAHATRVAKGVRQPAVKGRDEMKAIWMKFSAEERERYSHTLTGAAFLRAIVEGG